MEVYTPSSGYTCNQGDTFTNGVTYYAIISRNSTPATRFSGSILNAAHHANGLGTNDTVWAISWAEATGGASCPNNNPSGRFTGWNKLNTGAGWSLVNNSTAFHDVVSTCWTVHNVGPAGGYSVD